MNKKMRAKSIGSIVKEVCALENFDKQKKLEILRKYDNPGLRQFLDILFAEQIEWLLPEGSPPYKPNPNPDADGILYGEIRRLYIFTNQAPNLTPMKREMHFIRLLENVTPDDAELLIAMKDHKPPKGITKKLVEEAYGLQKV